jgi:tRNA (guanine-N7-)-methyltransferase
MVSTDTPSNAPPNPLRARRQGEAFAQDGAGDGTGNGAGDARPTWLRSYGRRRGRARSARQQALCEELLPTVALSLAEPPPARLAALFGRPCQDVWLEIGFGGGEHLLWQARHFPAVGFLGCEPFCDGILKVLGALRAEQLGNIRLFADDVRTLLGWLPPASIGRAFALFPDPWPKKRHHKRRLICEPTLAAVARVLKPGSELRLATDLAAYAAAMLAAAQGQGEFAVLTAGDGEEERPADWPPTRYEAKARACGRPCYFYVLQRR